MGLIDFIFKTKLGWSVLFLLVGAIILFICNWVDSQVLEYIGIGMMVIYPVGMLLVYMFCTYILNPIKERNKNK
jgi:hypothetical protein